MPETLLGLVLFLASIGPGYISVRVAERREPRPERSQLLEGAELAIVGAFSTTVAILLGVAVLQATGWLDVSELVTRPRAILAEHPLQVVLVVGSVLAASGVLSWVAARALFAGRPADIHPHLSVWRAAISRAAQPSGRAMAAVELKDGRTVSGFVFAYTLEPGAENREIALARPIYARSSSRALPSPIVSDFVLIPGEQIAYLSILDATAG